MQFIVWRKLEPSLLCPPGRGIIPLSSVSHSHQSLGSLHQMAVGVCSACIQPLFHLIMVWNHKSSDAHNSDILLLCLNYKLSFAVGVYEQKKKTITCTGFSAICDFRHHWGSEMVSPMEKGFFCAKSYIRKNVNMPYIERDSSLQLQRYRNR